MVCEGEREKGRWEWGEGAMVPGREALAKTPAWGRGGGPQRLPSHDSDGAAICPARSLPLPTPRSLQDSLSCQLKPSFHFQILSSYRFPCPSREGWASPAPQPCARAGESGPQPHPETRWAGPSITLQRRVWGEPISQLINARGSAPFHPLPKHKEASFSLPEGMAPYFRPKEEGTPEEGTNLLAPLRQRNQTSSDPLPPKPHHLPKKSERTPPLKEKQGKGLLQKAGASIKGARDPHLFGPPGVARKHLPPKQKNTARKPPPRDPPNRMEKGLNEPHFLPPKKARIPFQVGQGTPPPGERILPGAGRPPTPNPQERGCRSRSPPKKGPGTPPPSLSLKPGDRQAGPWLPGPGAGAAWTPRGPPQRPPPAPPPQGGQAGAGGPGGASSPSPQHGAQKRQSECEGERANAARGGKRMRPGEKASEKERACERHPPTPPFLLLLLLLCGPAQHGGRPPSSSSSSSPRGRCPGRAGGLTCRQGAGGGGGGAGWPGRRRGNTEEAKALMAAMAAAAILMAAAGGSRARPP